MSLIFKALNRLKQKPDDSARPPQTEMPRGNTYSARDLMSSAPVLGMFILVAMGLLYAGVMGFQYLLSEFNKPEKTPQHQIVSVSTDTNSANDQQARQAYEPQAAPAPLPEAPSEADMAFHPAPDHPQKMTLPEIQPVQKPPSDPVSYSAPVTVRQPGQILLPDQNAGKMVHAPPPPRHQVNAAGKPQNLTPENGGGMQQPPPPGVDDHLGTKKINAGSNSYKHPETGKKQPGIVAGQIVTEGSESSEITEIDGVTGVTGVTGAPAPSPAKKTMAQMESEKTAKLTETSRLIQNAIRNNDFEKAEKLLKSFQKKAGPGNLFILKTSAYLDMRRGKDDDAAKKLIDVLEKSGSDRASVINLAVSSINSGKHKKHAMKWLKQYTEANPADVDVYALYKRLSD